MATLTPDEAVAKGTEALARFEQKAWQIEADHKALLDQTIKEAEGRKIVTVRGFIQSLFNRKPS